MNTTEYSSNSTEARAAAIAIAVVVIPTLDILLNCDCCERHQQNKPITLEKWIEIIPSYRKSEQDDCECNCRHEARFICRNICGMVELSGESKCEN